uniref:Uncharacterized protein n=1 Tax=Anopheles darlingi TaxID=43151 RepID=A0A2M4D1B8_ANODA
MVMMMLLLLLLVVLVVIVVKEVLLVLAREASLVEAPFPITHAYDRSIKASGQLLPMTSLTAGELGHLEAVPIVQLRHIKASAHTPGRAERVRLRDLRVPLVPVVQLQSITFLDVPHPWIGGEATAARFRIRRRIPSFQVAIDRKNTSIILQSSHAQVAINIASRCSRCRHITMSRSARDREGTSGHHSGMLTVRVVDRLIGVNVLRVPVGFERSFARPWPLHRIVVKVVPVQDALLVVVLEPMFHVVLVCLHHLHLFLPKLFPLFPAAIVRFVKMVATFAMIVMATGVALVLVSIVLGTGRTSTASRSARRRCRRLLLLTARSSNGTALAGRTAACMLSVVVFIAISI